MSEDPQAPGAETKALAPPGVVTANPRSENSISVSWAYGPADQTNATRLEWFHENESVGTKDLPSGMRRYDIEGLNPATRYRVHAWGMIGEDVSATSQYADATTHPATSLPATPTNLVAVPSNREMDLTWSPSANASSYKISYGLAPSGPVIATETSTDPVHYFLGLKSNTSYYFDVRASNNFGDSAPARVVQKTLQVPDAPTDLKATPAISTMDLQWSASVGAVGYVIRYGVEPGGAATTIETQSLTATLTKLTPNTLYYVEVSAESGGNGESLPARITSKTLDGPPLPAKPYPFVAEAYFNEIKMSWGGSAPRYEVAYGFLEHYPQVIETFETQYNTYTVVDLVPLSQYFVEVRAINASGYSEPAYSPVTIGPDRTHPRNLSVPGRTFCEAWLRWSTPEDSAFLIDYEITCPGRPTEHTAELEYIATGLTSEVEYHFTVQPRRPPGRRPARSASISVTPHDHVPPTRPDGLRMTVFAPNDAQLSWRGSQDNVAVMGYEVRRNDGPWIMAIGTTHTFTELIDVDVDTFEVRASDAVNNHSLAASLKPKASPGNAPDAPTNFRVTPGIVPHLQWDRPTGSAKVNGYNIRINEPSGNILRYSSSTENLWPVLVPLIRYDVEIEAHNEHGNSPPLIGVITPLDTTEPDA